MNSEEKIFWENVNGIAIKFVVLFFFFFLFSSAISSPHRNEQKPCEWNVNFFCRNSCNFNRFTLFLCYYELSVFMFHSLRVPSSSSSSSSHRLYKISVLVSHIQWHTQYVCVCVCVWYLVTFSVKWNFTTTFVLVYAVFYFVSTSSFHFTQKIEWEREKKTQVFVSALLPGKDCLVA